jgi:hypothetical protein
MRSSNKSWDWGTLKGATGAGSTITPHYASQLMGSWSLSGPVFPPLPAPVILHSLSPGQRRTSGHGVRRVRPERHNPYSIATIRIAICTRVAQAPSSVSLLWIPFRIILGVNIGIGDCKRPGGNDSARRAMSLPEVPLR